MAINEERRGSEFEKTESWENSIEGIVCRMTVLGEATTRNDKDRRIIAETLLKLPKEVRDKVLEEVTFIYTAVERVICPFCPPPIGIGENEIKDVKEARLYISEHRPGPMILYNFAGIPDNRIRHLMAHEMAHFILGHSRPECRGGRSVEMAADDLSESWGFERAYPSYDMRGDRNKKDEG